MKTKNFLMALAVAVGMPCGMYAANYFFTPNGAGEMDGTSWENAAAGSDLGASLLGGFVVGDSVFLAEGAYLPDVSGQWTIMEGLTVMGGFPLTMTGTDTNITYPTAGETVFSADLDGDGMGENAESIFIQIGTDESSKETFSKVTLSGITIRDSKYTKASYYGGAMYIKHANVELNYVKFLNNSSAKGGVLCAWGSFLQCNDCIFRDNLGTGGAGSAFIIRQKNSLTTQPADAERDVLSSFVVFNRCEFTGNKGEANYGGGAGIADWAGDLYIINTTFSGSSCIRAGGAIRVGTGNHFYCISSTFFNNYTNNGDAQGSGDAISAGNNTLTYFANNIFVNEVDNFNPNLSQLFLQASTMTAYSGGYNVFGTNYDMSSNKDLWYASTDKTSTSADNVYKLAAVFGTNTLTDNGSATGNTWSKTIAPTMNLTGASAVALADSLVAWKVNSLALAVDLTKDQRGYARANTTMSGAMDINATAPVIESGIFSPTTAAAKWESLGMAHYRLADAKVIRVLNTNGVLVRAIDGNTADLSDCAQGVYVLVANGSAIKVIK